MLFYLDLNTSACAGIPSNIKNCGPGLHKRFRKTMWHITKRETVYVKRDTKSSWTVQRKKASVSVATWHDDCCHCFLYCSITQWLASAPAWGESNNSRSTIVHKEVKSIFPDKLLFLSCHNPKPDSFQFSYACV